MARQFDQPRAYPVLQPQPATPNFLQDPPLKTGEDIFARAKRQYPILNNPNLHFKLTPRPNQTLETWPPGESGFGETLRPKEFPINSYGVEVYNEDIPSIDILGDAVSHGLVNIDPFLKNSFETFKSSLTPQQLGILNKQYKWSQLNEGERRNFEDWKNASGLPGLYRGILFKQWGMDQSDIPNWYTPEQMRLFGEAEKYLGITPGLQFRPEPEDVVVPSDPTREQAPQ